MANRRLVVRRGGPSAKVRGLAALLLLTAAAGLLWAADDPAFRRVSDKLICQCGCHYPLSGCPHLDCPSAPRMRERIRQGLAAGQPEDAVLKAMVAEFGPAVLGAPPAEGFFLTGWVMPFAALLAGLLLTYRLARRWRARAKTPIADPLLLERYRQAIERESKEQGL